MYTLEITIQRNIGEGWPVVVEQGTSDVFLPVRAEGMFHLDLVELRSQVTPRDYGTLLGQALFRDAVRDAFMRVRAESNELLRCLLCVEDPELKTLRWERLCAPWDGRWDFLALDQRVPFSLYLPSLTDRRFPPIGRRDLRALVLVASPTGLEQYRLEAFDVQAAVACVRAALGEIPCTVLAPVADVGGLPTLDVLCEYLTAEPYTLLHVVCHGQFQREAGETVLYLARTDNQVDAVRGGRLLERLGRLRSVSGVPHFAFLATCDSASAEAEGAFGGLAQRLVRDLGMPAVVAMTEKVSVATAQTLTEGFYRRLREHGEVDRALVEAFSRMAERYDIVVPALYSRLGGRPLFSDTLARPLTPAEMIFGLDRLQELLLERAPVLQPAFEIQAGRLRGTSGAEAVALSPAAREEHTHTLAEVNALCGEVLDLSFNALALGQEPPAYDSRCPFRGLYPFQPADREFFFGREALVEHLCQKLAASPFLAVLGPSGSGKSSLVLAGLLPALQARTPELQMVYLTPGSDPLTQLVTALSGVHDQPTVLIVDQFEELFTLCPDANQRQAFLDRLLPLTAHMRVVLTMRADFWGECAPYRTLKEVMQTHQELVASMDAMELRRAMEMQAAKVGLRFEADLSNTILDDVRGEPGAMPLLQHALLELWQRRHGRWLWAAEYRALGGVQQAIARTAEALYAQLSPLEQERVRDIFVRLTRLDEEATQGEERRDTRRRVDAEELVPAGSSPAATKALVERLADVRLVVTSSNAATGREEVEVAHEALIRYWPRLRGWLDEDRASLRLREGIREAAQEWQAGGKEEGLLVHRGLRLQEAEALTGHARFALNALEQTYVDACSALREREQAAEEAQRQRELEAARQLAAEAEARRDAEEQARREAEQRAEEQASATRRLRRRAIGLLVLLAIATGSGIFAYQNARTATRTLVDADFLQATEKIEQQQADKALAYLARAVRTSSQDRAAAERIFSLLADRRFLLPASAPATLPGRITAIRFTPDDRWLVAVINGSTAQVFDARSGKSVTTLLEHDGRPVQMAQISPDGKLLATACGVSETLSEAAIWPQWRSRPYAEMAEANGYGHVWDIATSQPVTPRLEHEKAVLDIHFDTAGTRVATASDDQSVRVWDVASGQPVTPPLKHEAPVTSVRFSPDDTRLAAVAEHLQIWDIASAQLIGSSPTPAVVAAEYSPDGQRIAAVFGHDDQQLVLLNASTGLPIGPGSGDVPSITSFGFDRHDNDVLVSYAARHRIKDDTGGVQEMNGDGEAHELDQLSGRPTAAVAIAPDASEVFVAYFDHTVLWTSRYGFEESSVISSFTLPEPPLHIAVSASGKELIVIFGVGGNSVQLWSLETDAQHPELRSLPEPPKLQAVLDSPQEAGAIVDTSPDGKRVLQYNAKDALIVADARTGAPLSGPMHAVGGYEGGGIWTAKFSPNGKLIAIGEGGDFRLGKGFARIWDATTGRPLTDPLAHRLPVTFVAFSADHERLVTIGSYIGPERPGFIQVWDVRRGRPLTDALQNQIHAEFADLSRTHGQLTAVSAEGLAERRDVGFPLERSLPQWLPLLAEVTGGWRLNAQTGVLEPLPDRWQTLVSLRAEFASSRARDPFTRSGAWFLGNSQTRTISPYSELTVRDYVARCIADGGETLLDHAEALTAGNNELLAQIQARRAQ